MNSKDRIFLQKYLYTQSVQLTLSVDNSITPERISGQIAALVRKARAAVTAESESERLAQLLQLFYHEWGFRFPNEKPMSSQHLLIHRVLKGKEGLPSALGTLLLYLAAALDIPLFASNFPTQLVLRAELRGENGELKTRFIDSANGQTLDHQTMEKWLEGELGYEEILGREYLRIAYPENLSERLANIFKMVLTGEGNLEDALRLIENRLSDDPENPYEIRDRGVLFVGMGCYKAALEDLRFFVHHCPDDPSAVMLRLEMEMLEKESKKCVIH